MKYISTSTKFIISGLFLLSVCLVSAENSEHASLSSVNDENNLISNIYTSLHDAIETDRAYEVKKFIEFGADINYRYENAMTPLMLASKIGSIGVVKVLIELGADQKLTSDENMTAMDYAVKNNNKFVVSVLKTNLKSDVHDKSIVTQDIVTVESSNTKSEEGKPKAIKKPKVVALQTTNSSPSSSSKVKEKKGYPNIEGKYNAKTTATFSKCGNYNQKIEYYADETIEKVSKSGKFKILYTAPLLECKGKGRFVNNKKTIKGTYNCKYKTESGYQGTLFMKFQGDVFENNIDMNYKGQDTTPGIQCIYNWERSLVLNN